MATRKPRRVSKRKPRRAKKKPKMPRDYNPYINFFLENPRMYQRGQFSNGLPPAYLCEVSKDLPPDLAPPGKSFEAKCCNPNCDNKIINRWGAPWCRECGAMLNNEWRDWFWRLQNRKALDRLISDCFEED